MKDISLNNRQKQILKSLLSTSDWITGQDISLKVGVSDRTIRDDIEIINKSIKKFDALILSQRGKGYMLYTANSDCLHNLISNEKSAVLPTTPKERLEFICLKLLLDNQAILLDELEDELFISRTTLESDLRLVVSKLYDIAPDLIFVRTSSDIRIDGDEMSKRNAISEMFSDYFVNGWENQLAKYSIFDYSQSRQTYDHILSIVKSHNMKVSDMGIHSLVIYIAISIYRITHGNILEHNEQWILSENDENMIVAKEIESYINDSFGLKINKEEMYFIAFKLSLMRIYRLNNSNSKELLSHLDPKLVVVVEGLLNDIKREYMLDLTQDDDLFVSLVFHVKRLVDRINYSMEAYDSDVVNMLKNQYPFIFELAMFFSDNFQMMFGKKVNENELCLIAMHIGASLERLENTVVKNNHSIAVVSHMNYSESLFLMTKLKSNFENKITIMGPYYTYEKDDALLNNPSLILTTSKVDFGANCQVPVIQIEPLLSRHDMSTIEKRIQEIKDSASNNNDYAGGLSQFFEPEVFFRDVDVNTPFEAIEFLADNLYEKGYVPKTFKHDTIQREKMSSTSFINMIAMPHPIISKAYKTAIAVAILKKPIEWGRKGRKVKTVLMLSIKPSDKQIIKNFFNIMVEASENPKVAKKFASVSGYDEFIEIIKNYE